MRSFLIFVFLNFNLMQKVRDQIKDEDRGVLDQLDDNSIKELNHMNHKN